MQQLIWPASYWRKEYSQTSWGSNQTSGLITWELRIVKISIFWMMMKNTLSYEVVSCTMLMSMLEPPSTVWKLSR